MITTSFHRLINLLLLFLTIISFNSCFSPVEDSIEAIDGATKLKVTTRAVNGDIIYPVQILAYDDAGILRGQQVIKSANDDISLQLAEGFYHISAISGYDSYSMPKTFDKRTELIKIPSSGYAITPLMIGGADVLLGGANATVNIVLSYRVASVSLSLREAPSDVTAIDVAVSQQYGAVDMSGALTGNSTATIKCSHENDYWTTGTFYLLPGLGSSTTLTLSLTSPVGQRSYSYELKESLQATVPYSIEGTYVESTAPFISGVITAEGWSDIRAISFDFGSAISGGGNNPIVSVPTVNVSEIPTACSVWENHIVALVDNQTETEADLLLLSLNEFTDVYSPKAEAHAQEMSAIVMAYTEGAMQGWSVPTEEQARALRAVYAGEGNYDKLNVLILGLNGKEVAEYPSGNNNARTICAAGDKTFNWSKTGSITTAGSSVKYRLRLVKSVHVVKK